MALSGLGLSFSASGRDPSFTTFDAPGAGTGYGQGTPASGINPAGAITGWYLDASAVYHGFVRARDGTITTFDAVGSNGTLANGINAARAITGFYDVCAFQRFFMV